MISLIALCAIGLQEPSCTVTALPAETEAGPGKAIEIGLRFDIEPGWHIYWQNPGDSGEATQVKWELPEGWTEVDLRFPTPHAIDAGGVTNYGFENQVTLFARVKPPAEYRGDPVKLSGEATYLICKEACVPGSRKFTISLPGDAMEPAARLEAVRALPTPYQRAITSEYTGETLRIAFPEKQVSKAYFFPHDGTVLNHSAPQQLNKTVDGYELAAPLSKFSTAKPAKVSGVLVLSSNASARGYTVALSPKGKPQKGGKQ